MSLPKALKVMRNRTYPEGGYYLSAGPKYLYTVACDGRAYSVSRIREDVFTDNEGLPGWEVLEVEAPEGLIKFIANMQQVCHFF